MKYAIISPPQEALKSLYKALCSLFYYIAEVAEPGQRARLETDKKIRALRGFGDDLMA
jgi:hypothetical protein